MIIYRLTSPSGKSYIGQTVQPFKRRLSTHIRNWRQGKRYSALYYAFDKYNPNEWCFEVIDSASSQDDLDTLEKHYIQLFDSYLNGYNSTLGGSGGRRKLTHSIETKRKISQKLIGRNQWTDTQKKEIGLRKSHQWLICCPDGSEIFTNDLSTTAKEIGVKRSTLYNTFMNRSKTRSGYSLKSYQLS